MGNAEQIHQDAQDALDAQCKFYAELIARAKTVIEAKQYSKELDKVIKDIINNETAAIEALGDNDGTSGISQ